VTLLSSPRRRLLTSLLFAGAALAPNAAPALGGATEPWIGDVAYTTHRDLTDCDAITFDEEGNPLWSGVALTNEQLASLTPEVRAALEIALVAVKEPGKRVSYACVSIVDEDEGTLVPIEADIWLCGEYEVDGAGNATYAGALVWADLLQGDLPDLIAATSGRATWGPCVHLGVSGDEVFTTGVNAALCYTITLHEDDTLTVVLDGIEIHIPAGRAADQILRRSLEVGVAENIGLHVGAVYDVATDRLVGHASRHDQVKGCTGVLVPSPPLAPVTTPAPTRSMNKHPGVEITQPPTHMSAQRASGAAGESFEMPVLLLLASSGVLLGLAGSTRSMASRRH
jgi:hypothetical protein